MRGVWKGVGLAVLLGAWALTSACAGERAAQASAAPAPVAAGLLEALKGHDTGDMLPTNDARFQLQLSRLPSRFIVHMLAPREAVAPAVDAYFRNLGVEDLESVSLMWCETLKRGVQDVWSCNR